MSETLRLSNTPEFEDLLRDFARRLYPTLDRDKLVLAEIKTDLVHYNGDTFAYYLQPDNFRVEELDEMESEISPINGSRRQRRVIFSIRDEAGRWHRPIGTTCILKDIFRLELGRKAIATWESVILSSVHVNRQMEYLKAAGDDLSRYADSNKVRPFWFTQTYLNSLNHQDPLKIALHRLLTARIPLDRETLKQIRKLDQESSANDINAIISPNQQEDKSIFKPADFLKPPVQRELRKISPIVVKFLVPHSKHLLHRLSGDLYQEAYKLLSAKQDLNLGEEVDCTVDLYITLQKITGFSLTPEMINNRYSGGKKLTDANTKIALDNWDDIVPYLNLNYSTVKSKILKYHLINGMLTAKEHQDIQRALDRLSLSEERRNLEAENLRRHQEELEEKVRQDAIAQARQIYLKKQMEPGLQIYWSNLLPILKLVVDDGSELMNALLNKNLRNLDEAILKELLSYCKIAYHKDDLEEYIFIVENAGVLEDLPNYERSLLRIAIEHNIFSPDLKNYIQETAEKMFLDPRTFLPITIDKNLRNEIMGLWPYIRDYISDSENLKESLDLNKYTISQANRLSEILSARIRGGLSNSDREFILKNRQTWIDIDLQNSEEIFRSLRNQHYSIRVIGQVKRGIRLIKSHQREKVAAILREKQESERLLKLKRDQKSAMDLKDRLIRQHGNLHPNKILRLKQVEPAIILEKFPHLCQLFQDNGERLTLSMRDEIFQFLG